MTQTLAVELESIGHFYHPGDWVLRDISAHVNKGDIFAILGPNGRGKTTLINILLDVIAPCEGRVKITGRVGFVPQLFMPTFPYRVFDMVLMGRAPHVGVLSSPGQRDKKITLKALDMLDLGHWADRPFLELSGGERQMVMLARAIASEGEVLILDEPASALDMRNQQILFEMISQLSHEHGLTVLFTTHQPQHALTVANTAMLLMNRDTSPIIGPVDEVMTEETMSRLYGVGLRQVRTEHDGQVLTGFLPVPPEKRSIVRENG